MAGEEMKSESIAALSRRDLLRRGAVAASGVAAISLCPCAARAQAKISKADAEYQDTPKGAESCETCLPFEAPSSCQIVDGDVSASGWCKYYQPTA